MSLVNSSNNTNITVVEQINSMPMPASIPILTLIGNIYIGTIVSGLGFFFNLVCLVVFAYPEFKGDTYKYLIMKTITHLIILLLTSVNAIYNCSTCPISLLYEVNQFRIVANAFLISVTTTMAALWEIMLSYDRLLMFNKWTIKVSFNVSAPIVLITSFGLNTVFLFSFRVASRGPNAFFIMPSELAFNSIYRIYAVLMSILQSLISIIVLLFLNLLVSIEYRKYMTKRKSLLGAKTTNKSSIKEPTTGKETTSYWINNARKDQGETKESNNKEVRKSKEIKFTTMIVFCSSFFALTRFIILIGTVLLQVSPLVGLAQTHPIIGYTTMFGQVSAFIYFASNLLTYLAFNKIFRHRFSKIFHI
jgi:hypothetical protein